MLGSNNLLYLFCWTSTEIDSFFETDLDSIRSVFSKNEPQKLLSIDDGQPVISCAYLNPAVTRDGEFSCDKHAK